MEGPISHSPQLVDFIQWVFYALLSFIGYQAVEELKGLKRSLNILNEKVAVIIARVDTHEKRLDRHAEIIDKRDFK